jgi:hypothetical protein
MSDIWQQIHSGYADQGFSLPQEALVARAHRRRQQLVATGVAAGVLVVATGGTVALGSGGGGPVQLPFAASPTAERLDSGDYRAVVTSEAMADCLALAVSSPGGVFDPTGPSEEDPAGDPAAGTATEPFEPEAVFGFADERQWFTLLVSEEYQVGCWAAFDDAHADLFMTGGQGYPDGWLGDRPLPAFRHNTGRSDHTSQSYLVGLAPPGTERVVVALWDGTVVEAVLEGEWFAAWLPGSTGLVFVDTVSEVIAYTTDGPVTQVDDLLPRGTGPAPPADVGPSPTVLPEPAGQRPTDITPPSPAAGG